MKVKQRKKTKKYTLNNFSDKEAQVLKISNLRVRAADKKRNTRITWQNCDSEFVECQLKPHAQWVRVPVSIVHVLNYRSLVVPFDRRFSYTREDELPRNKLRIERNLSLEDFWP